MRLLAAIASGIKHRAKKVLRLARTAGIEAIHCLRHCSNYCWEQNQQRWL
ncbi:hypothetical protein H6G97_47360 [Nostoc flagelliforme FACHB-838]|uniref:Transposase n=1 Tax=Nostoc flagelliforme FACHB-838 TaxID=2692904 RepID=A0ABR8E4K4_9NOSO|nr:hypothetical protein [Nostoc flagelliforme]MBD2536494.1 hypothetical protein [Nostoc flagelliforme FACHB-838]